MSKLVKFIFFCLLFGMLVLLRAFEQQLFYDPLLLFFKGDYLLNEIPEIDTTKFLLHTGFRYFLNLIISLLIIYVAFREVDMVLFSSVIYAVLFISLMIWMYFLLNTSPDESNYRTLFYVRRFLIQPLLLFVLLPAFYYYKQHSK